MGIPPVESANRLRLVANQFTLTVLARGEGCVGAMPIRGLLDVQGAVFDPEDIKTITAAH